MSYFAIKHDHIPRTESDGSISPRSIPTGSPSRSARAPTPLRKHTDTGTASRTASQEIAPNDHATKAIRLTPITSFSEPQPRVGSDSVSAEAKISTSKSLWRASLTRNSPSEHVLPASAKVVQAIEPLRPPLRQLHTSQASVNSNRVKIETPFAGPDDRPQTHRSDQKGDHTLPDNAAIKKRSSIDPQQLFSVPITTFRNFGKSLTRRRQSVAAPTDISEVDTVNLPRHVGGLTSRVNSILKDVKRLSDQAASWSSRSVSSGASRASRFDRTDSLIKMLHCGSFKGAEMGLDELSESSSIRQLKMGPQPYNSPAEHDTYAIKRRPSAKTEHFLKIDISVRGGTSYLPSEATRIHTPPALKDRADGRKRGFFFDCDPSAYDGLRYDLVGQAPNPAGEMNLSLPTDLRPLLAPTKTRPRVKTGDWYAAKLEHLELEGQKPISRHESTPANPVFDGGGLPSPFLEDPMLLLDESQVDYNIPEHLPTSPLCPRNPRFGRVRRKQGNQYRGCWMHGYGAYEEGNIPGMNAVKPLIIQAVG